MTDSGGATAALPTLSIVRVAILVGGRIVDMALPADVPLREILPAIRRLSTTEEADDAGLSANAPRGLSLALIGGSPFSLEASLNTVGVVDGDFLVVQPIPVGPAAPGIVEDVADAAVLFASPHQGRWGGEQIQLLARAALFVLVLTATGFCTAHHVVIGSVAGLYAVGALAAVVVVAALMLSARSDGGASAGTELSVAALAPIAAVFALAVPGPLGGAQVMLASAGLTAWSVICIILIQRRLSFFTMISVIGAGMTLVGAITQIWQLPISAIGCVLLLLALAITVQAAQLSTLLARIPLPTIPAPGDPAPSTLEMQALLDLPRRIRVGEAHQAGLLAGAAALSVIGSLAIVGRSGAPGVWSWYAVTATALAALLRARIWSSSVCKFVLLAQPLVVTVGILVLFVTEGRYVGGLWALIVLAVVTTGLVVVAVNPQLAAAKQYSLPIRRMIGLFAGAVDASLVPVLAYLVGLFAWLLER